MSKNYFIIYWKIKILGSTFPLKFTLLNTIYQTLFILVIFWNLYILAWIAQKSQSLTQGLTCRWFILGLWEGWNIEAIKTNQRVP